MNDNKFMEIDLKEKFILSKHELLIDCNLKSLQTVEGTQKYAKKALRSVMGDDAEISNVKLRMPGVAARLKARLLKTTPKARLLVTTKF